MEGPNIIAGSISDRRYKDNKGNLWQYNSWSDRHSKVACWAVLFDVLLTAPRLRKHIREGKVGFGINHRMVDFATDKKKNLDLVLCIPRDDVKQGQSFASLADRYTIRLSESDAARLDVEFQLK